MGKKKTNSATNKLLTQLLVVQGGTQPHDPVNDRDPAHGAMTKLKGVLERDKDATVETTLCERLKKQRGVGACRIGFLLAEHYSCAGNVAGLRKLGRRTDPMFRNAVLEGVLCGVSEMEDSVRGPAMDMAIQGLQHDHQIVRATACALVSNLARYEDATRAIPHVPRLLEDSDRSALVQATCMVGHMARNRLDVQSCIDPLRRRIRDSETAAWAAWSLAEAAKRSGDISRAVPELVWLLKQPHEYSDPIRHATSALLNYAKQDSSAANRVTKAVVKAKFKSDSKLILRFQTALAKL